MKRIALFFSILCICLCIAACDAVDPENLFGMPDSPDTTAANSFADIDEGDYAYGNMQKNIPSGDFMRLGDEVLFTQARGSGFLLYSYDLTTGEIRPYCKDATCDHRKCGTGSLFGNLEQYDGDIYAMSTGNMVMKLENGKMEQQLDGAVNGFWHYGGDLYVETADASLLIYENGHGEPRTILEEYSRYWNVIFGQYLYGTAAGGLTRVDLLADEPVEEVLLENVNATVEGEHIYYTPDDSFYLYRCNMDGTEPELILDKPVLIKWGNFDEEYFYFRLYTNLELDGEDSHDIYRFPKDDPTDIQLIATLPESVGDIFTVPGTGKIFVQTRVIGGDGNRVPSPIYVMNSDGSDIKALEFPEA